MTIKCKLNKTSFMYIPLLLNWFKISVGIKIWATPLTSLKLSFVSPGNSISLFEFSVALAGSLASITERKPHKS